MSAQEDVNGLLAGASKTMAGARSCWLVRKKRRFPTNFSCKTGGEPTVSPPQKSFH